MTARGWSPSWVCAVRKLLNGEVLHALLRREATFFLLVLEAGGHIAHLKNAHLKGAAQIGMVELRKNSHYSLLRRRRHSAASLPTAMRLALPYCLLPWRYRGQVR